MIIRHSRMPAIVTLVIILLAGAAFAMTRSSSSSASEAQLTELQKALDQPGAKPVTWMLYGQKLQALGRYSRAVLAYKQFLETDPYNREARLQCCLCVASTGNADDFFKFMDATLKVDPKLALDVIQNRPEAAPYKSDARFPDFEKEAKAQSMD